MIRHLKLHDYQKIPWKNGLGFTYEIARSPIDQAIDFDWRISMADVETDSEFSFFVGKQRIISVLTGMGMLLRLKQHHCLEQKEVNVKCRTQFAFDGEQPVSCELLNGPIRDLNLIYVKDQVRPRVQWLTDCEPQAILTSAKEVLIFNLAENVVIQIEQNNYLLAPFESLRITHFDSILSIQLPQNLAKNCCFIELF